jgi:hypothetical protein
MLLKMAQGKHHGKAAEHNGHGTVPKHRRQFVARPVGLTTAHHISTGKARKHHYNAADGYPQGKFVRMDFFPPAAQPLLICLFYVQTACHHFYTYPLSANKASNTMAK